MGDSGIVSLYDFNSLPQNGEAQPTTTLKVSNLLAPHFAAKL